MDGRVKLKLTLSERRKKLYTRERVPRYSLISTNATRAEMHIVQTFFLLVARIALPNLLERNKFGQIINQPKKKPFRIVAFVYIFIFVIYIFEQYMMLIVFRM